MPLNYAPTNANCCSFIFSILINVLHEPIVQLRWIVDFWNLLPQKLNLLIDELEKCASEIFYLVVL